MSVVRRDMFRRLKQVDIWDVVGVAVVILLIFVVFGGWGVALAMYLTHGFPP